MALDLTLAGNGKRSRGCEGFAHRQTESPRTGDDGRRSKDVFSDDDEREIWSQIDALDYHARGW